MRPNFPLMRATLTGALGGLLFGFDTVVISGAIDALVKLYSLNPHEEGFTVAIGLVGTVIGALGAGQVGQRLGSRETLRITAALFLGSAFGCGLAWNWYAFMFFRFVGGLGIGASSVLGPVYIAELAPAKWRGRLVAAFQLNVVFGVMVAYISNYVIRTLNLGAAEWRWQIGVSAAPALVFLILLFSIPRSPRWSASKNRLEEALAVLKLMGDPDPQAELDDIREALKQEHAVAHEPVFRWKYRFPLFLAISIGAFNQLAGINAILYYLNFIFTAAGYSQISGYQQAMAVGATNFLFTLVGMAFIDKAGRKTLLLIGAAGCATCLAGVAWLFATNSHPGALIWLLVTFIAFFSVSQGAVIWVYIGEVFPTSVRAKGQGVGAGSHWFMATIIAQLFPVVVHSMSAAAPFIFFAIMTVVQFLVVLFVYPETKGQTLEDLQRRLLKSA
ncbi:MAG TPA: sugar porter family MFS transporter [Terracidiphilus sp.]|jgi:SP family arabinose:H+ symporter-like MFS transporter|nr:sugar porter family MFS transporter [Terracidiphilus sp.]